ncbi:MAG: hypothetical protein QW795_03480 [Candidatus Bathyarchaeia archaeon]
MKKILFFTTFIYLIFSIANAQNFYNTTYNEWKSLEIPQGNQGGISNVIFSAEQKYWDIRILKGLYTYPNYYWSIAVARYDLYGNLEEVRTTENVSGDATNFLLFNNYFTWGGNYYIIPFYNGTLTFLTFNLTKYKEGETGIEIMPYSINIHSNLVPTPEFTYHLIKGFGDSDFNNVPIVYRGTDNRIHIMYNFFDIANNTWHWNSKKDIIVDTGITNLVKAYVYPSYGGCRIHGNCFLYLIYEGNSTQNGNRYGIYLREIWKGTFGLEFTDIPLISTTTWGCYNFDYCYNGSITYWRIGNDILEANKILIRLKRPDKTYRYFFFKFNPYNWYKIEDVDINVEQSNVVAPYAREINATFWYRVQHSGTSRTDYYKFLDYYNVSKWTRFYFTTGVNTGTNNYVDKIVTVKFTDSYNESIYYKKEMCKVIYTGSADCLNYIDIPPGIYNITFEDYAGIRALPGSYGSTYFKDMDVFFTPVFTTLKQDNQFRVITDGYWYQEAFVSETSSLLLIQTVQVPYYVSKIRITKTCDFMETYPSNKYFVCDLEGISIPSNAINIIVKTTAKISVINGTMNSPDKTFELKACSPLAGVDEDAGKCEIRFISCTQEGMNTVVEKYRTALPGTTVTSNVHANVSDGCISSTGFPTWVKITGTTTVEYSLAPIGKMVSITIQPENGTEYTLFSFYLSTYNLDYPYMPTLVVDGEEYTIVQQPKYEKNWEVTWMFIGKPGIHKVYFKVRDNSGWVGTTEEKTVYVYGVGVAPFSLTVTPEEGDVMTNFRFSTSLIYNGTPPYYVVVYPIKYGEDAKIGSCTLPSSGICSFSRALPCYNETYIAKAVDSKGSVAFSNTVTPRVICKPLGETLKLTLDVDPKQGNTTTIFKFTLRVEGGSPPYYASWEDWGNMICYETYTSEPPFTVERRYKFFSGSRGIDVHVTSSDGQKERSNLIMLEVGWAGNPQSIAYDCTGSVGYGYTRGEFPTYEPMQQPLINQSMLVSTGAGWMGVFFTPLFISTLMLIGISGLITLSIAKYSGGDLKSSGAIFLGCVVLLTIIYSLSGIYPSWLVIVFIIIAGLIFAKFIIGVI